MELNRDHFSCLIPFYNEGRALLNVLSVLRNVNLIDQLICVDDGSINNLSASIIKAFPEVQLIKLSENRGKAEAVKVGLTHVKNDFVLLMDADLENVESTEISQGLNCFIRSRMLDSLVFQNCGDNYFIDHFLLRKDVVFSGKRVISRNDLTAVLEKNPRGFQLELAINLYQMASDRRVAWVGNSAYNPHKVKKMGFLKGMFADIRNDLKLFRYAGIGKYYFQLFFFCRKQLLLGVS